MDSSLPFSSRLNIEQCICRVAVSWVESTYFWKQKHCTEVSHFWLCSAEPGVQGMDQDRDDCDESTVWAVCVPSELGAVHEGWSALGHDRRRHRSSLQPQQVTHRASFIADISVISPQKTFHFYYLKNIFWIKVSKKTFYLNLKTEALVTHLAVL